VFLRLGAALHQRAGENLGPRDERAADTERRTREFFGGDAARHVLALAAFAEAAVLGGNRQAERADLREATDDFFGYVGVLAVHVLRVLGDDLLAETTESVLHHLVVVVEVPRPGARRERREHLGCAVGGDERVEVRQLRQLHAPHRLASEQPSGEVVHHVGDERARDGGFDFSLCAVIEQRPGGFERGTRVREVVCEYLLPLGPAALCELLGRATQQRRDAFDDARCNGEIFDGFGHESQR